MRPLIQLLLLLFKKAMIAGIAFNHSPNEDIIICFLRTKKISNKSKVLILSTSNALQNYSGESNAEKIQTNRKLVHGTTLLAMQTTWKGLRCTSTRNLLLN